MATHPLVDYPKLVHVLQRTHSTREILPSPSGLCLRRRSGTGSLSADVCGL